MTLPLVLANLWHWALQVLLLVTATGAVLAVVRVSDPRLRLRVWHGVIAGSLLLPLMQPWRALPVAVDTAEAVNTGRITEIWMIGLAGVLVMGVAMRLLWLVTGLARLRRLRDDALPWRRGPVWLDELQRRIGASAAFRVSPTIESAVTFGIRRPSVLVPGAFLRAPEIQQRAVAAHELHHVARRDWLWVIAEEATRALCWCHPAIWFALGEAQLAREEVVDRETIATTGNRRGYLEALIAAAEPAPAGALGFGPQFYRRRQLATRIRRLLQENAMSTRRTIVIAAALALVVPASVLGSGAAFPLVTVDRAVSAQERVPPPPPPPPAPAIPVPQDDAPPPPPPPPPPPAPVRVQRVEKPLPPPPPAPKRVRSVVKESVTTEPPRVIKYVLRESAGNDKPTPRVVTPKTLPPVVLKDEPESKATVTPTPKPVPAKPVPVKKGGGL